MQIIMLLIKKTFNNVINIELIITEIPYIDILILKKINDKLYWKNIEDGDYIYMIQLEECFYTTSSLLNKLEDKMNSLKRINYSITNKIYNNFTIKLESDIHKITFKSYNLSNLPNCLSLRLNIINNELYYILNITHPNNIVEINDIITISNASDVTIKDNTNSIQIKSIDASYFNKDHQIYAVNYDNQTYDIILGRNRNYIRIS